MTTLARQKAIPGEGGNLVEFGMKGAPGEPVAPAHVLGTEEQEKPPKGRQDPSSRNS